MRYYVPRLPYDTVSERLSHERVAAWEEALSTACETLDGASGSEVSAASVTVSRGAEGEVALLCGLVEELAAEYGLDASYKLGSGSFTVRFARPVGVPVRRP
jgi:hypothetical protein